MSSSALAGPRRIHLAQSPLFPKNELPGSGCLLFPPEPPLAATFSLRRRLIPRTRSASLSLAYGGS